MSKSIAKVKSLLNFEYEGIYRAQPSITEYDIFELYYEGKITKIFEPDYPINIGLFDLDILNLRGARKFNCYHELLDNTINDEDHFDGSYEDAVYGIESARIDLDKYDRVVFLKNLILLPKYRKHDILPELIKSIYLSHYTYKTLFMVSARPVQSLKDKIESYYSDYFIHVPVDGYVKDDGTIPERETVNVGEYYELNKLPEEDEGHYYKLFAKLQKLNLKQMADTPLFYFQTENDILKMIELNKFEYVNLF